MVENSNPISAAQNSELAAQAADPRGFARGLQSLYFPINYESIDHLVTFQILKFERVTRTSTLNSDAPIVNTGLPEQRLARRGLASITLPMPASLQTEYNTSYDTPDISALGELVATAASNARNTDPRQLGNNLGQALSGPFSAAAQGGTFGARITGMHASLQNSLNNLYRNLGPMAPSAGAAVASTAAGAAGRLSPAFTAALANVTNVARNPHKVVLFTGANFREHRFTYSLTPKNAKEAEIIYKIIKKFKFHMSPKYGLGNVGQISAGLVDGLGGGGVLANDLAGLTQEAGATSRAFFEYPEVFQIKFSRESTLFSIGESVLKSFSINYHPQNYPAYVRSLTQGGSKAYPSEVVIDMTFLETDVITKEQIEQNGR
jgi:hypothetical protein